MNREFCLISESYNIFDFLPSVCLFFGMKCHERKLTQLLLGFMLFCCRSKKGGLFYIIRHSSQIIYTAGRPNTPVDRKCFNVALRFVTIRILEKPNNWLLPISTYVLVPSSTLFEKMLRFSIHKKSPWNEWTYVLT